MGKYKLTTIKTTLATAKRLAKLKKQLGAKSIDELLTTLMNMYKIHEFTEEDIKQLSLCNDLIKPIESLEYEIQPLDKQFIEALTQFKRPILPQEYEILEKEGNK